MTNFVQALNDKLSDLQEEKETLEAQYEADLARIDAKVEAVQELLQDEGETSSAPAKKRGRPKGSKAKKTPKVDPEVLADYEEVVRSLGANATTPEEQARKVKGFRPTPRPSQKPSRNVKAGTKEEVMGSNKADDARVSIGDDE